MDNTNDTPWLGKSYVIEDHDVKPDGPFANFYAKQYLGIEVYRRPDVEAADLQPITDKDGLKVGDNILVPAHDHGYYSGEIKERDDGTLYGSFNNDTLLAALDYAPDARGCWVCTSLCYHPAECQWAVGRMDFR